LPKETNAKKKIAKVTIKQDLKKNYNFLFRYKNSLLAIIRARKKISP